ncbi:PqqD family protein [Halocella sp. SP3-1]|uniref:PqqD family protein n=1 Tax=Halocella sp. SP3-1 TaxID=2382161 RepID=UPI000F74E597|nr:PqqD family protein [Halocella sp. SP3-1]AZO96011.1 PqqD family protein [Halocella sp. SP3-1]
MASLVNKKLKGNIFEMIPERKENIHWKKNENGNIILIIKRNKWIDKLLQKIFNTPKQTTLEFDELGSFVWENIDGQKTIGNITGILRKQDSEKYSPVEERLITFMRVLKNNGFIKLYSKKNSNI